ncbi:KptA family-domain-containing protein [Podospora appendiculata]|uniref:2'-phosphotransferase n=1 Tax=Podospora appendiculata TaxID=314037 RepID=A0AAE0XEN3_9PEZI|nr:KptA family-domain-containing protein [Podospora appendiculata]
MEDDTAERFEEQLAAPSRAKGGGRARGGGSARGGGVKGRDVDLSRALSKLLRHQAASAGITLDNEGYAPLDRVLQYGPIRALKPTFSEIQTAVRESDKQRFAMKPNPATNSTLDESSTDPADWLIRANQGHSIKVDSSSLLTPLALPLPDGTQPPGTLPVPPTVIHGTYLAFWPRIVDAGGLHPMGRNHVHCSTGLPEDAAAGVVSGMRRDAEVLIYLDVEGSLRNGEQAGGIKWWMSDNGVVLTEGDAQGLVPVALFKEVVGRTQGVGLLWKDGEKVRDLPSGLHIKTPLGKGQAGRGGGRGRGK